MNVLAVSHHEMRTGRKQVGPGLLLPGVVDHEGRLPFLVVVLDDDGNGKAGHFVDFFVDGQTLDDILEVSGPPFFGEDGESVGIPFHESLARFDALFVLDLQLRSVDHRVAFALSALLVHHQDLPGAVHDDQIAVLVLNRGEVDELDHAAFPSFQRRLLGHPAGGASDVEGTHGELRAGLADGLSGDHPYRLAEIGQAPGGEVAAVAHRTDAASRLAGEHGADLDPLHAGILNGVGDVLGDLVIRGDDGFPGEAVLDGFETHETHDAVSQGFDHLACFDDRSHVDAVHRAAVRLGNDDILCNVDQAPGQIARVGRLERRVRQSLPSSVSRDEVLQYGEPFAEVAGDGRLDDLPGGLRHQTPHSRQLADLLLATAGPRIRHHEDRVELTLLSFLALHLLEHLLRHVVGDVGPDGDHLVVTFTLGDGSLAVLVVDLLHLLERRLHQPVLFAGDNQIVDSDGDAALGGIEETQIFERVQHLHGFRDPKPQVAEVHQIPESLLLQQTVDERDLFRQVIVEDHPAHRGVDDVAFDFLDLGVNHVLLVEGRGQVDDLTTVEHSDGTQGLHLASFEGQDYVLRAGKGPAGTLATRLCLGEVIAAQDHVLRGNRHRLSVGRRQDVARGEHQQRGLDLRLRGKGDVDRHLIPVEVRIERGADQRMDPNRLSFN